MELVSRADCGDREDEWARDMFTAQMSNEKIAEELLAEQERYRKHTNMQSDAKKHRTKQNHEIESSRIHAVCDDQTRTNELLPTQRRSRLIFAKLSVKQRNTCAEDKTQEENKTESTQLHFPKARF